jgi:uncharacterized membrane protein YccF (DUF307 family)
MGFLAWAGVRNAGTEAAIRVWWLAVVLLITGFACVGLAFLLAGGASLGLFYLGALLVGFSAAVGIPASCAVWRQHNAGPWPPR